ncbi:hypothetical protein PSN45_002176 [Yamadazyma tenuis]|uniref:DUF1000-domain-containing protein n=1 Tax=Candida tenuis (strain ATCC 10573 / BCRC 21748 / CBS 615 / JCM 9827 / NBRC 10315 / NRRL Y-1498 / VKM Y-70) TaxID=590646 RepID=G3BBU9_CANTC|nr:DUF1000-domain-containing protein [Yamadazyma tenuis ATCC 10573]EGV60085.1 DUF1000-domain-containing protein [Yamadazyma tenuis ATCC 10573]WEJ94682.1 hypothetical protein PSN45_002176 [Yamadazyma tenuis]
MSCEDQHLNSHHHGDDDGHHGDHGHDHSHVAPVPTNAAQSLLSKIDTPHVTALNLANPPEDLQKLFKKPQNKYELKPVVASDCDSQLIINIPFLNGSVKLFSLIIRTNGDKYCPKTIKLWKNDKNIDFDNASTKKPTFQIEHPHVGVMYNEDDGTMPESLDSDIEFVEHFLPRHIFTGVQSLTVFVEDIHNNDDEDETRLHYVELRGEFTELSRDPVITLYESAANPADHKNLTVSGSQANIL